MTPKHNLWFYWKIYIFVLLKGVSNQETDVIPYFRQISLPDDHVVHSPVEETIRHLLDTLLNRLQCVQLGLTFVECFRCLTPARVLDVLSLSAASPTLHVSHIRKLSVLFLYHVLTFEISCKSETNFPLNYDFYKSQIENFLCKEVNDDNSTREVDKQQTGNLLRKVKLVYYPEKLSECITLNSIWDALDKTEKKKDVALLSSLLLGYLLDGNCISIVGTYMDFINDVFRAYSQKCTGKMFLSGMEKIIDDVVKRNRGEEVDREEECIPERTSAYTSNDKIKVKVDFSITNQTEEEISTDNKSITKNNNEFSNSRIKRSDGTLDKTIFNHFYDYDLSQKCWLTEDILEIFGKQKDRNINKAEFHQLCPAVLQQISIGCYKITVTASVLDKDVALGSLYGYSSAAVILICLSSLVGLLLLPILSSSAYHYITAGFMGLAFSTMTSDALLHLIPQVLGSDQGHQDGSVGDDLYIWHQMTVILAIYFMFLFEVVSEIVINRKTEMKPMLKSMYYIPQTEEEPILPINLKSMNAITSTSIKEKADSQTEHITKRPPSVAFIHHEEEEPKREKPILPSANLCFNLSSIAWMVCLGDSFHNFTDGLAIGAAFQSSLQNGLFTSLAILCHEIPHELGDFIILLSTGLCFKKAVIINFISALFCFIGLFIGLQLANDSETRKWIMSATAGIFLYIAISEMLPELKKNRGLNPAKMLVIKNIGIIVGLIFTLFIAILEGQAH
ncbi:metal cation symporter ZIP8-like [Centruroides vittatus]|uniref:metal cation symporter ZIP8-like n=1 Tax=Centruroides vittatus TaxID=120091 RepID=UPI0035101DD3